MFFVGVGEGVDLIDNMSSFASGNGLTLNRW